jgi:hypothetical protein
MRVDDSLNDNTITPRRRGNNVSLNFDKKPTLSPGYEPRAAKTFQTEISEQAIVLTFYSAIAKKATFLMKHLTTNV